MKKISPENDWPDSWKQSAHYDAVEVFGEVDNRNLGYHYAYRERFRLTIEAVQRYVPPGSRIIDIAAAQGNFSLTLAELGYEVTWNDLREELIGYVKKKFVGGKIDYLPGNAFGLDIKRAYDAAIITEVIEHVARPDEFLINTASLVKPGGIIIMTTPNGQYWLNKLPKFSDCPDPSVYESIQFKPNSDGHIFLLYAHEVVDFAIKAGLKIETWKTFCNTLTAGHYGTRFILPFMRHSFVQLQEKLTSRNEGKSFSRVHQSLLTVFKVGE